MKKKTIIIILVAILIVAIITGVVCFFVFKGNNNTQEEQGYEISKLQKIYDNMKEKDAFTFSLTMNDNDKEVYAVNGETGYVDIYDEGEHTTNIVKDGNTYLLVYDTQKYYTYQNNTMILEKITGRFEDILSKSFSTGKEKINNKEYKYEEFSEYSNFLMNYDKNLNEDTAVTRFYFDGDKLVYIKTIYDGKEELLKVDIAYDKGDNNLYNIPSNFTEG